MTDNERPLPADIGRYQVVRLLGQGAMGRVLLAHDPVLDRDVAVKLLRDDLGIPREQRETLLSRMRQEARASARVSHPNIVALHDMGEDPELGLFLVFEYLVGETLKERLERGPLGPVSTARVAREIGSALATAHEAGVLHRDVKPDNIVLTKTGAKVADFGIARVPDSTLTLGGGLLGTPAYSAPEALSDGKFSPKSDQFSFAATLYETLSGRRAFPGDDAMAVANRISNEEPPPIAALLGVDSHVDSVLTRGLSKSPRTRFDTCEDLGNALAEALELAPRSTMPTLPDRVHRAATEDAATGRSTRIAAGGAAVGVLLTIATFRLTAQLRGETADVLRGPVVETAPAKDEDDPMPVAWLAERPTGGDLDEEGQRILLATGVRHREAISRTDGGTRRDASRARRDAGRDGGSPPQPDAAAPHPNR